MRLPDSLAVKEIRFACRNCGRAIRLSSRRCPRCGSVNAARDRLRAAAMLFGIGVLAYVVLHATL